MIVFAVLVGLLILISGFMLLIEHISLQRLLYKEKTPQYKLFNRYITGKITFSELVEENNKMLEEQKKKLRNKMRKEKLKKLNRKWL